MKYETFDKKVAEELSPICKDLFWFMHSLDRSGLQWDTNEVLEALEDVRKLEAVAEKATEAEKLLDVMALDGIKHWLSPRLLELYPEIHTDLKNALADLEAHDENMASRSLS